MPVTDIERQVLRELVRAARLLDGNRAKLREATAYMEANGIPGRDLEASAARCLAASDQADTIAIKISRPLVQRWRRRLQAGEIPAAKDY